MSDSHHDLEDLSDPPPPEMQRDARGLLELARRAAALKTVRRTGWLDRGVDPSLVESVADHSFGVALLAWGAAIQARANGAELDPQRVLMLALIHDLAEADTGDVPPYDPASIPEAVAADDRRAFLERRHVRDEVREAAKQAAEDAAVQTLIAALPPATQAPLAEIWDDLRRGTSAEARFVKHVDRLETFLQSRRYVAGDPELPVDSFRREVAETLDDPLLAAMRDAAQAESAESSED